MCEFDSFQFNLIRMAYITDRLVSIFVQDLMRHDIALHVVGVRTVSVRTLHHNQTFLPMVCALSAQELRYITNAKNKPFQCWIPKTSVSRKRDTRVKIGCVVKVKNTGSTRLWNTFSYPLIPGLIGVKAREDYVAKFNSMSDNNALHGQVIWVAQD